ncbi:polyketide cyclase [Kriegella sp. EG-1]|nr:polyketide cyclase [Flavobacteriaceae bacterium EG-1]
MYLVLYIILAILTLILLLALIAPTNYNVSRSIEVSRPKQEVFDYLRSLKKMDEWSPWAKKDPNMKKTFTGIDGEVGCISHWVGNKEVGEGEQEIKKIVNGERIDSELRFLKPWKSTSDCYLTVNDTTPNNTIVTWGFTGKNKFPMSIMTLFMSMDKMVGKDFEAGLAAMKEILEQ